MSFTVDVHHHILTDFFWRETNDAHNPVGGIAPPPRGRRPDALVHGRGGYRRGRDVDLEAGRPCRRRRPSPLARASMQ
jgi:hypothetical protein